MSCDSGAWHRWLGAAVALLGILLPADTVAAGLLPPADPLHGSVTTGIWVLKGVLILHAALFWLAPHLRAEDSGDGLVARPGPKEDPPSTGAGLGPRTELLLLAVILAMALLVRFPHLDSGLWYDEIQTLLDYVRTSPGHIVATFDSTNQHVLYSLSAHGAVAWLGESAFALRLPAVLFGAGGVWATWWFGRRVVPNREALLAAAFVGLSYHHVWFSQNARGYTALFFWTLVSCALFVDMLRTRSFSWKLVGGYAASTALAMYTHLTAGALLLSHLAVAGWLSFSNADRDVGPARATTLTGLAFAASVSLLLYSPVFPQAIETLAAPTMPAVAVEWENPMWMVTETVEGLAEGFPGGAIGLGTGGLVLAAGLISYCARVPAIAAAMLFPGILVVVGAVVRDHNLWPRFLFFSAGFGALMLIRGLFVLAEQLTEQRGHAVALACSFALVAGSAATVPRAWGAKQDFRGADHFLDQKRRVGDAAVALDLTELPLRDYLGGNYLSARSEEALARIEARHRRTWVVFTFPTRLSSAHPELWERIQTGYERVARFSGTVRGGTVVVMRRG